MKFWFECLCLLFSVQSFAGDTIKSDPRILRSELSGGVDSTIGFVRYNIVTENYPVFSISGAYHYSVSRRVQLGTQNVISGQGGASAFVKSSFYIPITYNWGGEDLRSDFFTRFAPGLTYKKNLSTSMQLQLGKRVKILENVCWRPTFGLSSEFGNGDPRPTLDFIPLAFSVVF